MAPERAQASRDRAVACRARAEAATSADVRQLLMQMADAHEAAAARQYNLPLANDLPD